MKTVAIYLLAALGGNAAPSADDLKKIAGSGAPGGPCSGDAAARMQGGAPGGSLEGKGSKRTARRVWQQLQPSSSARDNTVTAASPPPPRAVCCLAADTHTRPPCVPPLPAVGIELDAERVSKLLSELEGKDINEVGARLGPASCSGAANQRVLSGSSGPPPEGMQLRSCASRAGRRCRRAAPACCQRARMRGRAPRRASGGQDNSSAARRHARGFAGGIDAATRLNSAAVPPLRALLTRPRLGQLALPSAL